MLTNLVKLAAVKARDAAEEFFKLDNIDMAIKSLQAAKDFNPELPNIDDYFTAYKVHELAAKKSTWYELLALIDTEVDSCVIKKHYKRMALMLHPDKNHSVAADGAFKLIQSAFQVLSNPEKRKAYDNSFRSNKRASASKPSPSKSKKGSSWSRPQATTDHNFSKDQNYNAGTSSSFQYRNTAPKETSGACCHSQRFSIKTVRQADGCRKVVVSLNGQVVPMQPVRVGMDCYVRII